MLWYLLLVVLARLLFLVVHRISQCESVDMIGCLTCIQPALVFIFPLFFFPSFPFSIIERGEVECQSLIEAHKECMRQHGFNV